jgi:predicted glycoside hydrolase/deacetylase ChbG (UPF0249 family)
MKSIILCADDYGQSAAISQAIIQLLQKNRLSATSCLTTSPLWPAHAQWLKELQVPAQIGLHFNLTERKPLSQAMGNETSGTFFTLPKLLLKAYLRKLNFNAIFAELNAQIDAFEARIGHLPDYLDGHQHVHQFPVIRDVVFKIYDSRLGHRPGFYIRCVNDPLALLRAGRNAYLKKIIIQLSGASSFKKQLLQRKIPHNTSFSGIYNFKKSCDYSNLFNQFLKQITNDGLIMCHPGLEEKNTRDDVIYHSRPDEYHYFMSTAFLEACSAEQISIKHF